MDTCWLRTKPYLYIDQVLFNTIFPQYAKSKVSDFKVIRTGLRNSNYLFEIDGQKYVLRIATLNDSLIENEIKLNYILVNKVLCPKLITYNLHQGKYYLIYQYIVGSNYSEFLLNRKISPNHIGQIAKNLANLHSIEIQDSHQLAKIDTPPFIEWFDYFMANQQTANILGKSKCDIIKKFVRNNQDFILQIEDLKSLIHSDFRTGNMIITPKDEIYIIDWEYCGWGHLLGDIGQLFRYRTNFSDFDRKTFSQVYNLYAIHRLPNEWYTLARIRDLINPLQLLGHPSLTTNMKDDLVRVVTDIIAEVL